MALVGAFACAHTPQLLARPGTEDREIVLRVHEAFGRVKRRLEVLRPDLIAIVAGDHIEAFFLSGVPAFAVYVGTECAGSFGHYDYRFPIHEPVARAVVEQGVERGFDLFYTQDARNPGGNPQALTYAGTGINSGSWWLAWEDTPFAGGDDDFCDALLFLESVNPVPVNKTSWGSLKARFH